MKKVVLLSDWEDSVCLLKLYACLKMVVIFSLEKTRLFAFVLSEFKVAHV